jgi:hypothetical protein
MIFKILNEKNQIIDYLSVFNIPENNIDAFCLIYDWVQLMRKGASFRVVKPNEEIKKIDFKLLRTIVKN